VSISSRRPAHPGQILLERYLVPWQVSQINLARHLKVPMQRINQLINGKRGITPDTAWRLAAAFNTTPELWMNLQAQHDLASCQPATMHAALRPPAKRSARRAPAPATARRRKTRAAR